MTSFSFFLTTPIVYFAYAMSSICLHIVLDGRKIAIDLSVLNIPNLGAFYKKAGFIFWQPKIGYKIFLKYILVSKYYTELTQFFSKKLGVFRSVFTPP